MPFWLRPEDVDSLLEELKETSPPGTFKLLAHYPSRGSFIGKAVTLEHAKAWLAQFENEDFDLAFKVLTQITFFDLVDVHVMCRLSLLQLVDQHSPDLNRTIFVPVGRSSKSGQLIAYFFRTGNRLPPQRFHHASEVSTDTCHDASAIVFIDDYIGTGEQFSNWWRDSLLSEKQFEHIPQYYLSLVGASSGIKMIESNTRIRVVCLQERWDQQDFRMIEVDSDEMEYFFKKYGSGLFLVNGEDLYLGYGNCMSSVVFFYNVPDNAIPIVWSDKTNNRGQKWKPLFQRKEGSSESPIVELTTVIEDISMNRPLNDEDIILLCEMLSQLKQSAFPTLSRISDIKALILVLSEFCYQLAGGASNLTLWPPAITSVIANTRNWLISLLSERILGLDNPTLTPLIDLYSLESKTLVQSLFIFGLIDDQIQRVLDASPTVRRDELKRELLSRVCDRDYYVSVYCFMFCEYIVETNKYGELSKRDIASLKPHDIQTECHRLTLLALVDEEETAALESFCSVEIQKQVFFPDNLYGKRHVLSLFRIRTDRLISPRERSVAEVLLGSRNHPTKRGS